MERKGDMEQTVIEKKVAVSKFAADLNCKVVLGGEAEMLLNTVNVSRPGLLLAGFTDYFGVNRVQVLGNAEFEYLLAMEAEARTAALTRLAEQTIPCIIVSRGREIFPELLTVCGRHHIPLMVCDHTTGSIINLLVIYLNRELAPSLTRHGGLLDVYGMGILLTGKSGIGKSETALEMVKRGHRMIADDSVIIKRIDAKLIGSCPEMIRYFMEIRGIGIIDVRSMYGVGSVLQEKQIDLVVELENWDENKVYDRLGDKPLYEEILGVTLPKLIIPVRPGRNLAIILEVAARNSRLKELGYDAAKEIINRSLNF